MSEAVQVALIVSTGPVITAVVVHFLQNRKLDHITFLANSTLTAANERIASLEEQVRALKADGNVEKKEGPSGSRGRVIDKSHDYPNKT